MNQTLRREAGISPCRLLVVVVACGVVLAGMGEAFGAGPSVTLGDTIKVSGSVRLGEGTYPGPFVLGDGDVLEGTSPAACVIEGDGTGALVTVSGAVRIRGLTIRGAGTGILVKAGASLEIEDCHVLGCSEDGIGFERAFDTHLVMRDCVISKNGDGVDLESTQAVLLGSRFVENRDDGLDLDGEAGALVYDCVFADNGDDGIEIRLATRTHAIVQQCRFEGNGEDGLEVIDSPVEKGIHNVLCVQGSTFEGNGRYGVGFVDQEKETLTDRTLQTAVYAAANAFVEGQGEAGVSSNYADVFVAGDGYPDSVAVLVGEEGASASEPVVVQMPALVGVYNLRPTTDGTMVQDAEGVAVQEGQVFVADDVHHVIHVLDRRTGRVVRAIPTAPFAGSDHQAPGPEGLCVVTEQDRQCLLLSDDDGKALWWLPIEEGAEYGHVVRRMSTEDFGSAEGVEVVGDRIVAAANHSYLFTLTGDGKQRVGPPVQLRFEGFGEHIAGVGVDDATGNVFATVSGYTGGDQTWRNHRSAFFEVGPALDEVRAFWHLGPFSNDPRGIAVADGLVYVADGRSPFTDSRTGEENRGGIKVLVFLRVLDQGRIERALDVLPIWRE